MSHNTLDSNIGNETATAVGGVVTPYVISLPRTGLLKQLIFDLRVGSYSPILTHELGQEPFTFLGDGWIGGKSYMYSNGMEVLADLFCITREDAEHIFNGLAYPEPFLITVDDLCSRIMDVIGGDHD